MSSQFTKEEVLQLNKKLDLDEIETSLVKIYVDSFSNGGPDNNFLEKIYLEADQNDVKTIKNTLEFEEGSITLSDIIRIFELSVPEKDRELNGVYFTPSEITDYMVDDLLDEKGTVCDYACGSGAFLIKAADHLLEITNLEIGEILEEYIYGVDILEYNVRKTRVLLSLLAYREGCGRNLELNIKKGDSLQIEWRKKFPAVFENDGFDYIISNPPYVKIQNLEKTTKEDIKSDYEVVFSGNFNIFIPFFELAIDITNSKGKTSLITPLNYFTTLTGRELRNYLQENKYVSKIIDFDKILLFEDVKAYTAITNLNKKRKSSLDYAVISDESKLNKLSDIDYISVKYSSLDPEKWRLLDNQDYENIDRIENIGQSLDDLADIRVGIATLKDSVYIVDGSTEDENGYLNKEFKGREFKVEKEITRPLRKISDLENEEHLEKYDKRIICPYETHVEKKKRLDGKEERDINHSLISEQEMEEKYPKALNYLEAAREKLGTRENGSADYQIWYAYGREQGLNLYGPRLYTPTYSKGPKFMKDDVDDALFSNGYAIFPKPHRDIEVIQKVINSKIMDYYMRKTSKDIERGYQCYQKNFMRRFSVPKFSNEEKEKIKRLSGDDLDLFLIEKYGVSINGQ